MIPSNIRALGNATIGDFPNFRLTGRNQNMDSILSRYCHHKINIANYVKSSSNFNLKFRDDLTQFVIRGVPDKFLASNRKQCYYNRMYCNYNYNYCFSFCELIFSDVLQSL